MPHLGLLCFTSLCSLLSGTFREILPVHEAIARFGNWLSARSMFSKENFAVSPEIEADDWRQAQVLMKSDAAKLAKKGRIKILADGNSTREITILPTPALLSLSTDESDPRAYVTDCMKDYLRVVKTGIHDDYDFDEAMDVLDSCVMLWELDEEESEIKYQCSCSAFWSKYKCEHSLAMSILKKDVEVPLMYNIKNLGENRKRGRPKLAKAGDALSKYESGRRSRPR